MKQLGVNEYTKIISENMWIIWIVLKVKPGIILFMSYNTSSIIDTSLLNNIKLHCGKVHFPKTQ